MVWEQVCNARYTGHPKRFIVGWIAQPLYRVLNLMYGFEGLIREPSGTAVIDFCKWPLQLNHDRHGILRSLDTHQVWLSNLGSVLDDNTSMVTLTKRELSDEFHELKWHK